MLTLLLLACGGPHEPFDIAEDALRYGNAPSLLEVSRECVHGEARFRARTIGWSSGGMVERFGPYDGEAYPLLERLTLATVGFDAREWCDISEAPSDRDSPEAGQCDARFDDEVVVIRVWYEEGCAGCVILGPAAASVRDQITADVESGLGFDDSGDCPISTCDLVTDGTYDVVDHAAGCQEP